MPLFKIKTHSLKNYSVPTEKFSNTAVVAFAQTLTPKVRLANVANSAFTISGDTAVNIGGGYIVLTGSDFVSGAQVLVGNTPATSTSFVNSSILQVQVPARPAGTYNVFVVNPDGGTGIRVNGVTYSTFPAFSTGTTLTSQTSGAAFGLSISATSDSNVTYSNTSALPAGTTLLANGWFYGANSVTANTTYSFTVKATDAENQDTDRTFSVTVTVDLPVGLWAWGFNSQGTLGLNNVASRSRPVQVGSNTNWKLISNGLYTTAAIKTDGTLWAWGRNTQGQLGLNDSEPVYRSSPVQVGSATNWSLVSTNWRHTAAIKTDGTLWTWGDNLYGQLGTNNTVSRSSPVQVGILTNWSQVSMSAAHLIFIKTNGTLWTSGYNPSGQLGLNDRVYRSSPVQVGVATNWSQISGGVGNSSKIAAIKTDGTLWTWGAGFGGSLGLNDSEVYRSSPTQVGTGTTWSLVSMGTGNPIAIKTDGTLWGWGLNQQGQLGLNDRVYRSSPVQIGVETNWSKISSGQYFITAIKTNGTLWTCGFSNFGQLGQNDLTRRSSPVQLGVATNWSNVSSGVYSTIAITI